MEAEKLLKFWGEFMDKRGAMENELQFFSDPPLFPRSMNLKKK